MWLCMPTPPPSPQPNFSFPYSASRVLVTLSLVSSLILFSASSMMFHFSGWLLTFLLCHGHHCFVCSGPQSAAGNPCLRTSGCSEACSHSSSWSQGWRTSSGQLAHLHLGHSACSGGGQTR